MHPKTKSTIVDPAISIGNCDAICYVTSDGEVSFDSFIPTTQTPKLKIGCKGGCEYCEKEFIISVKVFREKIHKNINVECSQCSKNKISSYYDDNGVEFDRQTIEYVSRAFDERGKILLEEKYINKLTRMKYVCNCGLVTSGTYTSVITHGQSCGKYRDHTDTREVWFPYITSFFEKHGCKLLSLPSEYKNSTSCNLKFICFCGKNTETSWRQFFILHGCGCGDRPYDDSVNQIWTDIVKRYGSIQNLMTILSNNVSTLTELLIKEGIPETDIIKHDKIPSFPFTFNGDHRQYRPDILIRSQNILIDTSHLNNFFSHIKYNFLKFDSVPNSYKLFVCIHDENVNKIFSLAPDILKTKYDIPDEPVVAHQLSLDDIRQIIVKRGRGLGTEDYCISILQPQGLYPTEDFRLCGPTKNPVDIMCINSRHRFQTSYYAIVRKPIVCRECEKINKFNRDQKLYTDICSKLDLEFIKFIYHHRTGYIITCKCKKCEKISDITSETIDKRKTKGCKECCQIYKESI